MTVRTWSWHLWNAYVKELSLHWRRLAAPALKWGRRTLKKLPRALGSYWLGLDLFEPKFSSSQSRVFKTLKNNIKKTNKSPPSAPPFEYNLWTHLAPQETQNWARIFNIQNKMETVWFDSPWANHVIWSLFWFFWGKQLPLILMDSSFRSYAVQHGINLQLCSPKQWGVLCVLLSNVRWDWVFRSFLQAGTMMLDYWKKNKTKRDIYFWDSVLTADRLA